MMTSCSLLFCHQVKAKVKQSSANESSLIIKSSQAQPTCQGTDIQIIKLVPIHSLIKGIDSQADGYSNSECRFLGGSFLPLLPLLTNSKAFDAVGQISRWHKLLKEVEKEKYWMQKLTCTKISNYPHLLDLWMSLRNICCKYLTYL